MALDLNKNSKTFKEYFHTIINSRVESFIKELEVDHITYLFSGILRNYFLNVYELPRDLDIVISKKGNLSNLKTLLNRYGNYTLNAFGGFKINIRDVVIDIWYIEDTWAIRNNLVKVESEPIEKVVLRSTFFNFSSILYEFKNDIFIYDQIFEDFYNTKTIEIVLKDNLSELLCLINIVYYAEKYKLNLSENVKEYFLKGFVRYTNENYNEIQLKHFKCIKYDYSLLKSFNESLKYSVDL